MPPEYVDKSTEECLKFIVVAFKREENLEKLITSVHSFKMVKETTTKKSHKKSKVWRKSVPTRKMRKVGKIPEFKPKNLETEIEEEPEILPDTSGAPQTPETHETLETPKTHETAQTLEIQKSSSKKGASLSRLLNSMLRVFQKKKNSINSRILAPRAGQSIIT